MNKPQSTPLRPGFKSLIAGLILFGVALVTVGWGDADQPLPEQSPEAVVEQFYEYISESKIRGGTLLIREAFKLTSGGQSRYDQAKFMEVINRYPAGFKATIVKTDIQGVHADVAIEYEMATMFGDAYAVNSVIPLVVDKETNTWKIDFRGDTDGQNLDKIKKDYAKKNPELAAAKGAGK